MPRPFPKLAGERMGLLLVTSRTRMVGRCQMYVCICDCGSETMAVPHDLRVGKKKSCGCLKRLIGAQKLKHGDAVGGFLSPEYRIWCGMKNRCSDLKHPNYGAAGVTVCERWRKDFKAFLTDMGRRPSPYHSLDRKDPEGNYEPGNCRWATAKEQSRNRRTTVYVEFEGKRIPLADACEATGMNYDAAKWRLRQGYPFNQPRRVSS